MRKTKKTREKKSKICRIMSKNKIKYGKKEKKKKIINNLEYIV